MVICGSSNQTCLRECEQTLCESTNSCGLHCECEAKASAEDAVWLWAGAAVSFGFLSGGSLERGGDEEEASGPPGEHVEPDELLQVNVDGETPRPCAQAVDSSQTHLGCRTATLWTHNSTSKSSCLFALHRSLCLLSPWRYLTENIFVTAKHAVAIRLLQPQEGLCRMWLGASCFRSSPRCTGAVQSCHS